MDEGVGVSLTSSPSRAKKPFSWAAQIGQLKPPGKTITWSVERVWAPAPSGAVSASSPTRATVVLRIAPPSRSGLETDRVRGLPPTISQADGHRGAAGRPSGGLRWLADEGDGGVG